MNNRLLHVYKANYKLLFRVVYSMTTNIDDTEDILQEVLIKTMNNTSHLTEKHSLPWCITVARHTAIDYLKKYRKNKIHYSFQGNQIAATFVGTEYDYNYLDLRIIVFDYLSTLDSEVQQSLYLNLFENKSAKQISEQLNIDYEKLRHIIWREKKHLRRIIELY